MYAQHLSTAPSTSKKNPLEHQQDHHGSGSCPQFQPFAVKPQNVAESNNPQDGASAVDHTTVKKEFSQSQPTKFPSAPALGSIRTKVEKSSSRLAFPSSSSSSSLAPLFPQRASDGFEQDGSDFCGEEEDVDDLMSWWGAGKRGGANDRSQKESLHAHNASTHYPPTNVATEPPPKTHRQPHHQAGTDVETILEDLKASSLSWTRCAESDLHRRYVIEETVGSGLTADVHCGRAADGSWVALKAYKHLGSVWRWPNQPDALESDEFRDPILRGIRHLMSEVGCLKCLESKVGAVCASLDLDQHCIEGLDVRVVEVVMTEKSTYLIQQFGGKLTLYDIMSRCHGNEPFARNVFKQLLLSVQVCHKSGIVHRDIKPENILVSYKDEPWEKDWRRGAVAGAGRNDTVVPCSRSSSNFRDLIDMEDGEDSLGVNGGEPSQSSETAATYDTSPGFPSKFIPITRLVDFGLACIVRNDDDQGESSKVSGACGTPLYAAPEVLRGASGNKGAARSMDGRSGRHSSSDVLYDGEMADMYSLGVILFTLLCGRLPFEAESIAELLRVTQQEVNIPPFVSQHAGDLIRSLMCADAESRPTAEAALRHAWMEGGSLPSTPVLKALGSKEPVNDRFRLESRLTESLDDDEDEDGGGMWYC